MSDTWIEKAIVLSIDMIVNKRISQASFDTTIKAIVKSCSDETIGEYIVRYQDSDLTVYASSVNNHYLEGDLVLVHVPRNDLTRRKTIIGSTTLLATTYQEIPSTSSLYNKIGTNIITGVIGDNPVLSLSSYENHLTTIWEKGGEKNWIALNEEGLNTYISRGNGLAVGMYVRTDFDDSQLNGDYGLIVNLKFTDSNGDAAVRSYVVGSKDVIGNPYRLNKPTFILYLINDINIEEFQGILSIQIYNKGFPIDLNKTNIKDIFFSNLQIFGAGSLTEQELNGYSLHINYSKNGDTITKKEEPVKDLNGNIIKDQDGKEQTITVIVPVLVTALLKVKGKIVTKDVEYYWFRENGRVIRGSNYGHYSMYGGDGWECLNYYSEDDLKHPVPRVKPLFIFTSLTSDFQASNGTAALSLKQTKIKCVAVIENQEIASGQCIIYNSTITQSLSIESSDKNADGQTNKTIYYLDNGNPTLTCIVTEEDKDKEIDLDKLSYEWSIIPARGDAINCRNSTDFNYYELSTELNIIVENYKFLKESLDKLTLQDQLKFLTKNIDKLPALTGKTLKLRYLQLEQEYTKLKSQRPFIETNVFHNFSIASIVNYSTISCAVFYNNSYQGTVSITLYNKPELTGMYSLNLENGVKTFQYDKKGNSPASPQLEKPLKIEPLTFTLLDNTGKEIPYNQIINSVNQGYVKWYIPKEQTLLLYIKSSLSEQLLTEDNFYVFENREYFPYTIANVYDSKKNQNYIKLVVKYKDIILETYSNLTFPKDGDPGTNGTDYVAKIVPDKEDAETVYVNNYTRTSGSSTTNLPFDNQGRNVDRLQFLLYNNSNKVNDNDIVPHIEILKNQKSLIGINANKQLYYNNSIFNNNPVENDGVAFWAWIKNTKPIDIIRQYVLVNNIKYYTEYPVCFNYIIKKYEGKYKYRIKLKPKTGYQYVMYSEDGTLPDYDNTLPFEVILLLLIYNSNTNLVYYQRVDSSNIHYRWFVIGNFLGKSSEGREVLIPSEEDPTELVRNDNPTMEIKPLPKFDGKDVYSAVVCQVYDTSISNDYNTQILGYLHIPVYMYINRYGHTALNEWDGNSINLGEGGDGIILAPQVGAGQKDKDEHGVELNTFTGVLMGVQRPNNGNSDGSDDDIGLFGYSGGQRSIFLDSKTGNATFGKEGAAQIKIDAQSGLGTITSGDYNYNTTKGSDGKPIGKGLKIKFSSDGDGPYIKYGSGNFSVNSEGHIHAVGGGDIANWNIDDNRIYKESDTTSVGMASGNYKLTDLGVNDDSLGVPSTSQVAFYAGQPDSYIKTKDTEINNNKTYYIKNNDNEYIKVNQPTKTNIKNYYEKITGRKYNFFVTPGGFFYSKRGKIATWDIDKDKLSNSIVGMGEGPASTYKYNTSDKDSVPNPRFWAGNANDLIFAVNSDGKLYSKSGKIANWNISSTALTNGNTGLGNKVFNNKSGNTYTNPFGLSITARFWSGSSGVDTNDSKLNFAIDQLGKLYSKAGKIGGWTITENKLYGGNKDLGQAGIRLNSNGSMNGGAGYSKETGVGGKWFINENGSSSFTGITTNYMTANNVTANTITANDLTANNGGTIGGWTIGSSYLKSSDEKITLYNTGTLQGPSWKISSDGNASFKKLSGTLTGELNTGSGGSIKTGSSGNHGLYAPHSGTPKIYDGTDTLEPQEGKLVSALVLNRYIGPFSIATAYVSETVVTGVNFETKTASTKSIKVPADTRKLSTVVYGWNEATKTKTVKFMTASTVSQDSSESDE